MWKVTPCGEDGTPVDVLEEAFLFTSTGMPPLLPQKCRVFSQKFTTDGTPSGTSDMGVDGSAASVEYYIPSNDNDDRYITRFTFILGYGASAGGWEFADSNAALTNGVKVSYTNTEGDEVTIMNPKANYSFHRASGIPLSNTNWEARGFAVAGDYGFFVNIDLTTIMPPYGIKLDAGTPQKMSILIRDDCTDADLFNCNAFGFERFE